MRRNPLGTPIAMTDDSGTVVWTHRFSPFGDSLELNEDPDNDGESISLNLRFPGQYYDAESGLHYNWWRYYEPGTGMYLSADQMTSVSEMVNLWRQVIVDHRNTGRTENLLFLQQPALQSYIYTGGNPLLFIDPMGFWYIDFNASFFLIKGWNIGLQINSTGLYYYWSHGYGFGYGFSVMYSHSQPNLGQYTSVQGARNAICGQFGEGFGKWYMEAGFINGWPPTSFTFTTTHEAEWFKWSDWHM